MWLRRVGPADHAALPLAADAQNALYVCSLTVVTGLCTQPYIRLF
jgi:hypothetical protein